MQLSPLSERLVRFPEIGEQRWSAWLRKNDIAGFPALADAVTRIGEFADPLLLDEHRGVDGTSRSKSG